MAASHHGMLPLIKASGWDEAAAFSERLSEQGQLVYGLGTRIDMWNLGLLLHPEWDETPTGHDKLAFSVSGIDAHDRDLVSRRDVVSRRKVRARNSCRTKQRAIGIARDEIVVSTAHDPADKHSLPGP